MKSTFFVRLIFIRSISTRSIFIRLIPAWLICLALLASCTPTPTGNVLGYLLAKQLGQLTPAPPDGPRGALTGLVMGEGAPLAGASVVVAERTGRPHAALSGADGRYRIEGIPPGQYAVAAVAPGFAEQVVSNLFGMPDLVTITASQTTDAGVLQLTPLAPVPLPQPWPASAHLQLTASGVLTAPFPAGSVATVQAYSFVREGVLVDTLRLYLPVGATTDCLPMLLMVYPTAVDLWETVSVAFAAQGFGVVAISPAAARGTDIAAHAEDARWALLLAQSGALSPQIKGGKPVALGGSFSSAILYQLVRRSGDAIAAWVTLGGVSDAFAGAEAFYRGELEIPPQYEYLIPALGMPNLYPLLFLRYSPLYAAAELPPTLIIHTAADRVIPIEQAYRLEAALRTAGVPVEVYYYDDVSHYLQIDERMSDAGREMFDRTLDYARRMRKGACESG